MTTLRAGKPGFLERIGIFPPLAIGYLGVLLFMVGDGVEAGFLSPMLVDMHFTERQVALVFTLYGATAAISSWLSGTLSDLWGPKKVMWAGLFIWIGCEIPFLLVGIAHRNYPVIAATYMLRGFGYPLFAFGFLVWVTAATPQVYLATSVGWFWAARTGGLPTLGSLLASFSVPRYGMYASLWISTVFVVAGGLIALLGVHEQRGRRGLQVGRTGHPFAVLFSGISIIWKKPKVGLGGLVAIITTTSEFGFLLFLPIYYTRTVGFSLREWLQILSIMFATNVVFNLIWGAVGDRVGWRRTITYVGACGCAVATLGLYYVPHHFGPNYLLLMFAGMAYGITLAGFVPLSAIMATLAPESRGAAMSVMNLGSGTSIWLGPAIAGIFLPLLGVSGVIWIFAGLYVLSALVASQLRLPGEGRSPAAV